MLDIAEFVYRHAPEPVARWFYRASRQVRRLVRLIRYRRMPKEGWGKGWRVLVFRYGPTRGRELHVLAPVDGAGFDWDLLRTHVRGEPWPAIVHEPGRETGVMDWAGHHIAVVTDEFGWQRLPMRDLIPGEFCGGVDVGLVLLDVREARMQQG